MFTFSKRFFILFALKKNVVEWEFNIRIQQENNHTGWLICYTLWLFILFEYKEKYKSCVNNSRYMVICSFLDFLKASLVWFGFMAYQPL